MTHIDERTGITIDPTRDDLLSDFAKKLVEEHYTRPGESIQEAFARASRAWGSNLEHSQRLYDGCSKGHFMFASPVLSNAPLPGESLRGLPISCFLTHVDDSVDSLCDHTTEARKLSVAGGGVGAHWSDVRGAGGKAPGVIGFMHTHDADMEVWKQGMTRKGAYAAYLDISHPDIREFIGIRTPTGDAHRKCLGGGFHHGVNITDGFMGAVKDNADWSLIDPNTYDIKEVVKARELWEQILETRYRTGEPYLCFIDQANADLPRQMREKGLRINGSNLCTEIFLPTAPGRTAVCCLSSLNAEFFLEWDKDLVGDVVEMLDNVITYFIENAPPALSSAVYSATRERSIGVGLMGLHSYFQRYGIAYESETAVRTSKGIQEYIYKDAVDRSRILGMERGIPEDAKGTRNALLIAIAPNANSSIILNTSPSTEVTKANAYKHQTRVGTWLVKNKYLEEYLRDAGIYTEEIWADITRNRGSVQHLDMPEGFKNVFKTAIEVDQSWVIKHAAARQPFIDQGQSVNLFFPHRASRSYLNKVHMEAWESGLKSCYYLRTETKNTAEEVGVKVQRDALKDSIKNDEGECLACHG